MRYPGWQITWQMNMQQFRNEFIMICMKSIKYLTSRDVSFKNGGNFYLKKWGKMTKFNIFTDTKVFLIEFDFVKLKFQ